MLFFSLLVLASTALAYQCTDFTVPVTVTAPTVIPPFPAFKTHYDAVGLLSALTARNAPNAPSPPPIIENLSATFDISLRYCEPDHRRHASAKGVQVLSHGLGFDKSYWDFGGQGSEYNYISSAIAAGFATLSYDRLGNGGSSIVDTYTVQQGPVQLAVLTSITKRLRDGNLHSNVPRPAGGKVFHVGHSYGSLLTHGLLATAPKLSDGAVLTGYNLQILGIEQFETSTTFHLAKENQPARFGGRSTGSLTWADELANQYNFLAWPYFDPAVLAKAEARKWPFSLGELITYAAVPNNASAYAGSVLLISGDVDRIYCAGDCTGTLESAAKTFVGTKRVETYLQPRTGHGLNLHFNATAGYKVVQDFLGRVEG
ncbi:hypothetical protein B0A48_16908 [Cryoendolithus antarcticus]|uniref:AB hydrolase-1 domain-containing protein n=1 Tax=Cryoendolithus antarcticus TaxID=1507870 RepID=A0A1V8SCK8_9PEZI|nr:hypothetical protein B0A48_16908 [Cryoendolithus antarcticus]